LVLALFIVKCEKTLPYDHRIALKTSFTLASQLSTVCGDQEKLLWRMASGNVVAIYYPRAIFNFK